MKNKMLYVLGIVVAVLVIGGTVFFIGADKDAAQVAGGVPASTPAIEEVVTDSDVNVQTPDVAVEKFEWEDRETCVGVQVRIITDCLSHSEPRNASDMLEGLTTGTVLKVEAEVYQNNEFIGWVKTEQGYIDLENAEWVIVDAAEVEEEIVEAPANTEEPAPVVEEVPADEPVDEPAPTEAPVVEPEEPAPTEVPADEPIVPAPTEVPDEEPVVPAEPAEPSEPQEPEKPAPTPVPKKEEPTPPPAPVDNGDDFMSQLEAMGIIIDDSNTDYGSNVSMTGRLE
ncbi:MAG: hypothetical protein IJ379_04695 [Lachnospiraceae bacterium]|nr:hypothetical protein [Lachnospiraceae bacterium]